VKASAEIASCGKRQFRGKARKAEKHAMARITRAKKFLFFSCNAASAHYGLSDG
jgi:hypothetical protein